MTVFWTDAAYEHPFGIRGYLSRTSPVYAEEMVDRLLRRSDTLGAVPRVGKRVAEYHQDDVREIIEPPYRILYRILPERIDVLAVLHPSQPRPPAL